MPDKPHFQYSYVRKRPVQWLFACLYGSDGIHHLHALDHFPEYRIQLVQVRAAPQFLIYGPVIGWDFPALQPECLRRIQPRIRPSLALDNIELAATAGTGRIDIVVVTRSPEGASLMKKGRPELCRNGIARSSAAPLAHGLARMAIFAVRISRLNHKIPDDAM